jgi:lysophospholipase L1-like esterase
MRRILAAAGLVLAVSGQAAEPMLNVVFDGDSISAGAGATEQHGLDFQLAVGLKRPLQLHNVAVGGRPVSECLRLYASLVAPLFVADAPANVIVFHAGDNDIARGQGAAATYAAFTAYVAAAHRQGFRVVVSTELRRPDFSPPLEAALEDYNARLRGNAAGADAVVDFDADPRMADLTRRNDPGLFIHDHVHPADDGYAVLAALLLPAVRRVAGG